MSCSVIIVTYNSQIHLPKALECLEQQTHQADEIIIVDTGSANSSYLSNYTASKNIHVLFAEKEAGFCKGNNIGFSHVSKKCEFLLFLNPDAFLSPSFINDAIHFMQNGNNSHCGALTGITLGYDISKNRPTGKYDSTGILPTWYGSWYDRGQGEEFHPHKFNKIEEIPAICGAVFFCRKKALDQVIINNQEILDSSFYMYKEDIDLSLRLRKKRWKLIFLPHLIAYHCRGWNPDRSKMPRRMRLCSAKNELRINMRRRSIFGTLYSSLKFTAVKLWNV